MKALFLAASSEAWGETLIGLSLARKARYAGVESRFVIDPHTQLLLADSGFAYEVLDPGNAEAAERLIDAAVRDFAPDAIVLSDYFMYVRLADIREGFDPWFIDRYKRPIVPIDFWELDAGSEEGDIFGGRGQSIFEERGRLTELCPRLRPVPPCHISQSSGRALAFSVCDEDARPSPSATNRIRKELGVPSDGRLILLTMPKWQLERFGDPDGDRVADLVPALLGHYLRQLPEGTHFGLVGEVPPRLALPHERTHLLPPCAPRRFDDLVASADLFISLNIPSTTLARSVMSDVPSVVVINSYGFRDTHERDRVLDALDAGPFVRTWSERCTPLYPFRLWPLGCYKFLEPLLAHNSYSTTFAQAELLDEPGTVLLVKRLLYDAQTQAALQEARAAYRAELSKLPDAGETLVQAVAQGHVRV